MAGKFTVLEYRRLDKAVDDEIETINKDSIEYHDYTHISKKIKQEIAKQEQKEIEEEQEGFKNKKSKNKWECTECGEIVKIKMVKQCEKCGKSGDNIRLSLLEDTTDDDENEE